METELKLRLDPATAHAVKDLPLLLEHASSEPAEREQHDIYYDTARRDLWRHGVAVRIRATPHGYVQTVKDAGESVAGLHRRQELEAQVEGSAPDLALLRRQLEAIAPKLAALVDDDGDGLQPVFRIDTRRTVWTITLPAGDQIECALDLGDLVADNERVPFAELELELLSGAPACLFELAQALHRVHPVHLENVSKAERGFALAVPRDLRAVKARPVRLQRKCRLGEALGEILMNCVQQMQANERGVLENDAESLHQLRVGLRRLRAALDMVRDVARPPEPVAADLEWLAGELGEARNWDVFLQSVLPDLLPSNLKDKEAQAIRGAAEDEAQRHRQHVRHALNGARYTSLMLGLGGWIAGRAWEGGADGRNAVGARVRGSARKLVRHAAARLRKRVRKLDLRDAACLHKVRIAAKKERYAREFFAAIRSGDHPRLQRLTDAQDELGALNDAHIAHGLIEQLKSRAPQAAATLAYMQGVLAGRSEDQRRRARKHVRRLFG